MNAANNQASTVTWTDIASNPKFQSADPETRQKIRDAFASEVVIPGAPESLRSEVRDKFMSATQADILGRGNDAAASESSIDKPGSGPERWASVRDSEAFQQADWQERQRMRGEYYDDQVRPGIPRGLEEQVLGRFMSETEGDVFGKGDTDARASSLPQQAAVPEEDGEGEDGGFWQAAGNAAQGAADRGMELAGNALQYLGNSGEWREDAFGGVPVLGEMVDYANPDWLNQALRSAGQKLEDADSGYDQRYSWEGLKADPTPENLLGYIGEQGVRSVPDMAAALALLPAYIVTRAQENGEERARNNGKSPENGQLSAGQYAQALPAAALSGVLERFGAKGVVGIGQRPVRGAGGVVRATAGAAVREAGTEFAQENIEYAGTNLGTEAGYSGRTALDRGLAGAVAGAGVGGGIRAGTATAEAIRGPREAAPGDDADEQRDAPPTNQGPDANPDPLVYENANYTEAEVDQAWANNRGADADQGLAGDADSETVKRAADLIRTPRGELSSADRERRDALTYGDGYKALRARAQAQGLNDAVADLDQASEEVSQAFEDETLARASGQGGDIQEVRTRLDGAAQLFTRAASQISGSQPTVAEEGPSPQRAQQRKQQAIAEAQAQTSAAGGDALQQASAGLQAEQMADSVTTQETAAAAPRRGAEIGDRLHAATMLADEMESSELDQQNQVRLRNMRGFLKRAGSAYEAGEFDRAANILGLADRVGNVMESDPMRASAAIETRQDAASLPPQGAQGINPVRWDAQPETTQQTATQGDNADTQSQASLASSQPEQSSSPGIAGRYAQGRAQQSGAPHVRVNGQPFGTERSVQLSKAYRDALKAGRNPQVVPVGNGFGYHLPEAEEATTPSATPPPASTNGGIPNEAAQPSATADDGLRRRANGQPFSTEQLARASGVYRDAQRQGRSAQAVPVEGGFAVRVDEPIASPEPPRARASVEQDSLATAEPVGQAAGRQRDRDPDYQPKFLPREALLDYFERQGEQNPELPYSDFEEAGREPEAIIEAFVEHFGEQPEAGPETIRKQAGVKAKELTEAYEEGQKAGERVSETIVDEPRSPESQPDQAGDGDAPSQATLFSLAERNPDIKPPTVEAIQEVLGGRAEFSEVEVIAHPRDLPPAALFGMALRHVNPADVRGMYHQDRLYVIADNNESVEEAVQTAVHEAVGHRGMRGVLGKRLDLVIYQLQRDLQKTRAGREALSTVRDTYDFLDPNNPEDRRTIAEELMAHYAEQVPVDQRPSAWQRAVSRVREMLRRAFPSVAWTEGDVLSLIEQSRGWLRRQNQQAEQSASDVEGELGLSSVVQGDGTEAGISVEEAQRIADDFLAGYNGNVPLELRVATTQEELYGPEATRERVGSIKGAYHPARGVLTLAASNLRNARDARATLAHEVLGHYGLNTFAPAEKRQVLDAILAMESDESLAPYWEHVRRHYPSASRDVQAEEVFAFAAEQPRSRLGQAWDRVLANLQRAMRRAGFIRQPLSRSELHDMARTIGREIRNGDRQQQNFPETDQDLFSRDGTGPTGQNDLSQGKMPLLSQGKTAYLAEPAGELDTTRYSLNSGAAGSAGGYSDNDSTNFSLPDEKLTDVVLRRMADKMRPLKRLQKSIKDAGGDIEEEADAYLAEELFHGKAEFDLRRLRDQHVAPLAEGLAKSGISQKQLDEYLYARHAPERNAVIAERNPDNPAMADGGSGMTNADAAQIIERVQQSGKQAEYDRLAEIVYAMTRQRREAIRDAGLEDGDVVDAWEAAYQFYVPLKGQAKDEPGRAHTGRGYEIGGRESRSALGRKSRAESPSSQVIVDATESIIRVRKNEVGNSLLSLVSDHPNRELWEVFTDERPDTQRAEVRIKDPETGRTRIEVRERPVNMAGNQAYFKTKRAGRTFYIKIHDERLMNAMRNVGPEPGDLITKFIGPATRRLASLMTSYNPEFMLGNFARDIQTAMLNLSAEQTRHDGKVRGEKIAAQTVKDIAPAMKAAWRGLSGKAGKDETAREWDRWFREFQADGAKTGYFDMKDAQGQAREIEAMMKQAAGGVGGNLRRFKSKTGEFVENMNGAVENAVRLAAYTNARRAGISRKQSASLAKNMTVNFNRRGEVGTTLNALFMFANASIQGSANVVRTMTGPKAAPEDGNRNPWARMNTAQKLAMGLATGAYALGMLNRWLSEEDDDGVLFYDKIPSYIKERNIVLMTGRWTGKPGDYQSFPLPYGFNVFAVAGTYGEAVANGPMPPMEAAKNLGLAVLGSFSPIGFEDSDDTTNLMLKNLTPTLARSVTQIGVNEKFSGGPIYKENFDFGTPKPDSALSFRSTPEAYKDMAQFLNDLFGGSEYRSGAIDVSPDVLQHLVNFYGGGAWGFVEKTADYAKRKVTGEEVDRYRVPFAGRFMGSVTPYGDQSDFYDRRNELGQIYEEATNTRGEAGASFRREHREEIRLFNYAKDVEKSLRDFRKARDRVKASDNLSEAEKKARVENIEKLMKRRVDRFNERYNALGERAAASE